MRKLFILIIECVKFIWAYMSKIFINWNSACSTTHKTGMRIDFCHLKIITFSAKIEMKEIFLKKKHRISFPLRWRIEIEIISNTVFDLLHNFSFIIISTEKWYNLIGEKGYAQFKSLQWKKKCLNDFRECMMSKLEWIFANKKWQQM